MARNRGNVEQVEAPVEETAEAPVEVPAENNGEKPTRRQSPEGEEISLEDLEKEFATRSKGGRWVSRAKWFKENPGKIKVYRGVSPTTASHLKREHGLDAATRNTRDEGKTADLIVGYFPEGMEKPKVFRRNTKKDSSES